MLTLRRALALASLTFCLFLLSRWTSSPSPIPAFGSARKGIYATPIEGLQQHGSPPLATGESPGIHYPPGYKKLKAQKPLGDISRQPLRHRLAYHFPYDLEGKFPAYIWQTWKYAPDSGNFKEEFRPMEASWSEMHPGFVHQVITDDIALHLLRHLYSAVPDVIDAYESLPQAVLKADFFRYLILLARGGVYSDIDTFVIRSAVDWVPPDVPRSTYGLVIGIEADPDREDWAEWYSRRIQFCQWTIQAKAGHPVLRETVAAITEKTLEMKRAGTLTTWSSNGVIEFTGPAVWTDTIMKFFNDPAYFDIKPSAENITWKQFTGITQAKKVGDVVVLPITCFSPGIKTMNAGDDDDPMAFVKHYFEGTWKPESERHIGEEQ